MLTNLNTSPKFTIKLGFYTSNSCTRSTLIRKRKRKLIGIWQVILMPSWNRSWKSSQLVRIRIIWSTRTTKTLSRKRIKVVTKRCPRGEEKKSRDGVSTSSTLYVLRKYSVWLLPKILTFPMWPCQWWKVSPRLCRAIRDSFLISTPKLSNKGQIWARIRLKRNRFSRQPNT